MVLGEKAGVPRVPSTKIEELPDNHFDLIEIFLEEYPCLPARVPSTKWCRQNRHSNYQQSIIFKILFVQNKARSFYSPFHKNKYKPRHLFNKSKH